jgi:D-glycero-D-manno-heptose 1,7-bisphosphate phosphatase
MLLRAAREHGLDLANAVIIGDSESDLMAGRSAGTAAILIRGNGEPPRDADAVVEDLAAAVRLISLTRKDAIDAA